MSTSTSSIINPDIDPRLLALRERLDRGLESLGLRNDAAPALLSYLDLLLRWNQAFNLTAIREPTDMLSKHLFDSLAIHAHLPAGELVDIGSGAGLPGIPLALVKTDLQVTLIETAGKKSRFQREATRALGLADRVRVVSARAEDVPEHGRFSCLVARAFGTLAQIIDVGGHLLAPGGQLLAMKGREPTDELAQLPAGWRHVATHALAVPELAAERCLCIVEAAPVTQRD